MRLHATCVLLGSLLCVARPTRAQEWNTPDIVALVERAVSRRAGAVGDGGLTDYRARARGFVLFLTQLGAGLEAPPVLVKTDQLVLEVYWQFPGRSKQRIVGWRDRLDLPTEIQYHRDHLGIVQNSFGDRIRLGDGHEVNAVPHPLSRAGLAHYDFAGVDSVAMTVEGRTLRVVEVRVRPRVPTDPGVVGSVFLDVASAEVVRFRFGFSRASYRDETVEDITVLLEHALWNGRFWLPRSQQVEIRRRTGWLDFPARGIIRVRWELDDYQFNTGLDPALFAGREIEPAPAAVRDTFAWERTMEEDLRAAVGPLAALDLEAVRAELDEVVASRLRSGLPRSAVGGRGISDLAHFNRVEGLALGLGGVARVLGGSVEARAWAGYGVSDRRAKLRGAVRVERGRWTIGLEGRREVRDFQDEPVVSPLANSLGAQEGGVDHGDYLLAEGVEVGAETRWGGGGVRFSAGTERVAPIGVVAEPARGAFRPNPAFPAGRFSTLRVRTDFGVPAPSGRVSVRGRIAVEGGGGGGATYGRLGVAAQLQADAGSGRLVARVQGGVGTENLPAHRTFALGGRGTLVGERFRAWGGRTAAWGTVEWQFAIPVPRLGVGPVLSTGETLTLGPFAGVGWARRPVAGLPGVESGGARPVVGVAIEWLRGLIRWEVGWSVRDGRVRGALDVRRDLWGIL